MSIQEKTQKMVDEYNDDSRRLARAVNGLRQPWHPVSELGLIDFVLGKLEQMEARYVGI